MKENLYDQRFTISLVKSAQEFYLHVEDLGILVHDKDLGLAYEKMEKEKKEVLERLATAGITSVSSSRQKKGCNPWSAFLIIFMFMAFFLVGIHYMLDQSAGKIGSAISALGNDISTSAQRLVKTNKPEKELKHKKIFGKTWLVADGGNGHYYRLVLAHDGGITGTDAKKKAEMMGGYLATLTSMVENDFCVCTRCGRSIRLHALWSLSARSLDRDGKTKRPVYFLSFRQLPA